MVSFECVRQPAGEPLRPEGARRVGQMRRLGRASLRYWGCEEAVTEEAAVLISELVTNALQHGRGPHIGFAISCSEAAVRIEVGGDSSELPTLCRDPATDAERGRGLLLVAELSDAWGTSPDGKRTWCELKLCDDADGPPQ
ncbi:ATP-binding protein [Streptomyces sp. NBC_00829]|uniref:ATP-binding protein n=1 Tax=Streptomyces sp. NBC_00829 TaxID=2903679 RepID=UPI00386C7A22|nr:ATP-binding protein [Streptomyces sp. NBC_00829]